MDRIRSKKLSLAKTAAFNTGYVDTSNMYDLSVMVINVSDGTGDTNLTFVGSPDQSNNYALGVRPETTNAVDADGVINTGITSTIKKYKVDGVHNFVKITCAEVATGYTISLYLLYREEV